MKNKKEVRNEEKEKEGQKTTKKVNEDWEKLKKAFREAGKRGGEAG